MYLFTATVDHLDEDYGFWCQLEITAKLSPETDADVAEMVGTPKEVCCLDARFHPGQGDPIKCCPNEDETRCELGMRIWLNAEKGWKEAVEEKWINAYLSERDQRREAADELRQMTGA